MAGPNNLDTRLKLALIAGCVTLLSACGAGTDMSSNSAGVPEVGQAMEPGNSELPAQMASEVQTPSTSPPSAPAGPNSQETEQEPAPAPVEPEPVPTPEPTEPEPTPTPVPIEPEPVPEPEPEPEPVPVPVEMEPESEPAPPPPVNVSCTADSADVQASALSLINAARATARSCGDTLFEAAPPVTWNSKLAAAAQIHSNDMAQFNFFSHTGSDGASVSQRVDNQQYTWRTVGENIAAGQPTTEIVIDAWLDSPGHCKNIMNPNFEETAVVCVENTGSQYRQYWTNVLATSF